MVLAFLVAAADQLAQVQVAAAVLAQQHDPARVIRVIRVLHQHVGARDRLDAGVDGGAVKLDQRKEVVLVRHGHGRRRI